MVRRRSERTLSVGKPSYPNIQALKGNLVMSATNTLTEQEIPQPIFASAPGQRLVGFIWGWMGTGGDIDPDTEINDNTNVRFAISTTDDFDDTDIPLPNDREVILFHENVAHIPATASAIGNYQEHYGIPWGMFPVPIPFAADSLFASLDTTGWPAAADIQYTLFIEYRLVSPIEFLDIFATFAGRA